MAGHIGGVVVLPAYEGYGFGNSLVYFLSLSVLAWQYPGVPAKFGGLLNYISRFHTQNLALLGIGLTIIGLALRYAPASSGNMKSLRNNAG